MNAVLMINEEVLSRDNCFFGMCNIFAMACAPMCGSPKRDKLAAVRVPPNISHRRGSVTIVPWGIQMPRVGRQRLYRNCENSAGLA